MKTFDHIFPWSMGVVWGHLTSRITLLCYPREKDDAVKITVKSFVYKEQMYRDISTMENGRPLRCASCKRGPSIRKLDFFHFSFYFLYKVEIFSFLQWSPEPGFLNSFKHTHISNQAPWWEGNSLPVEWPRCNPAFTRLHQPVGVRGHMRMTLSQ